MTDYPPEPDQPGYTPPPVTSPPPQAPPVAPGYQYPTYPPGYPPPPGYGYGYPPPYPYPYPQYLPYAPPGSGRPGLATTASVLAYVVAGMLIIAGIILLAGASLAHDLGSDGGFDTRDATAELTFDGLVDFVTAGLLIAGGVLLAGRKPTGRVLLFTALGVDVAAAIYWLARLGTAGGAVIFYALLFTVPVVLAGCFAGAPTVGRWLSGAAPSYR